MSQLPPLPDHMRPLAPGYTQRQVELDAEMVSLGRPTLPISKLLNPAARAAHRAEVEAWDDAHDSTTDMRNGPCRCGAATSCATRWLELRGEMRAVDAGLYKERYGGEAYARKRLHDAGFTDEGLVDKALRDLRDNACFTAARDWCRDGTQWVLVLSGNPGCGKTQAATWAAVQLMMRNGFSPRLAFCPTVSDGALYGMEAEEYRWRCREEARLLVLDDLGEGEQRNEKRGIWRSWVDEVLSSRYAARRKTIITTNRTPAELKAWLGERIIDRLREGSFISTNEKSMRGQPREPGSEG